MRACERRVGNLAAQVNVKVDRCYKVEIVQVTLLDASDGAHIMAIIVLIPAVVGNVPSIVVIESTHIGRDTQSTMVKNGVTQLHTGHDVGCTARVVALQGASFFIGSDVEDTALVVSFW